MKAPKDVKGAEKIKKWARLFENYRPPTAMYEDMAIRYFVWDEVFALESKAVIKAGGGAVAYKNGTGGQSAHFQNMKQAEGEMRRLQDRMAPYFVHPKANDLGQFGDL